MQTCGACQADSADGAKFCSSCGSSLAVTCPSCGTPASGKFCSECGTAIDGPRIPRPATPVEAPARVAERRITSVLFGDLVAFTTLSESLDPDDVRELLSRYFNVCRTIVERYGGTVEKFIGDAVMAVWGVPVAHEDDAERAVRAGLDVVAAVAALGDEVDAPGLAMRVGVVTGEVAVNVGATGEGMVAGDAVNTASRVQSTASAGQVWVDDETRALTSAAVQYEDRGEHELKGKAAPVRLFEARQVIAAVGGARRVDGLEAPLAGRDRELRVVKEMFHATLEEGKPRLVAVYGAAGVGKSRIGWEFEKYYDGVDIDINGHDGRCLSYGDGVAFWALAEMIRGRLRILEGDSNDVVLERLRQGMEQYVPHTDDRAWLLPRIATLLGVADIVAPGASYTREDLFASWRTFLEHVSRSDGMAGAVLRIDDLQWADPGLLDFIGHVLEYAQAPIFILTFARSDLLERAPNFGSGRRATTVHLEPLADAPMASLVDGLVGGLPQQLRDTLVQRAEGIPLFAVETVRALIDRDVVIPSEGRYVLAANATDRTDLDDLALPTSLHTLIASRLDGLTAEERRLVQDAAVLGQCFSQAGLDALMAALDESADLSGALAALVRKEIFSVETDTRSPEHGQFRFVQALVRTVAYETLSRRDRKARHLAVAEFLASEPDAETIPAVIASHYLDAYAAAGQDADADELATRAVLSLERAASHAQELGAPEEARRHLKAALALVEEPETVGRLGLAAARAALNCGATAEATELAEEARRVFEGAGLDVEAARCIALWSEAQIYAGAGNLATEPAAAAYERVANRPGAEAVAAELALTVARAHYLSTGDTLASIPWFDRAVVLGEALEDLPLLSSTLASYAGALVLSGRSRMGLGLLRVSLDIARDLGDPTSQIKPLNNLVSFLATRDLAAARDYMDEGLTAVRRAGDREWGLTLLGSAVHVLWNAGEWDAALQLIDELDYEADHGPILVLTTAYAAAIREARGLPIELPKIRDLPVGMRTDVVLEAARALVASFERRADRDIDGAAAKSSTSVKDYIISSGIDDDFAIFWVTALNDRLLVGDVAGAKELCTTVEAQPRGHIAPLIRNLLPWMRARTQAAAGADVAVVDADFEAAVIGLRDFGASFYAGRAMLDHAEWLAATDRAADAEPLFAESAALFQTLGATPWQTRAQRTVKLPAEATRVVPAGT